MADLKHETEIQDAPPSLIEGGKQGASPSGSGSRASIKPADAGLPASGGIDPSRAEDPEPLLDPALVEEAKAMIALDCNCNRDCKVNQEGICTCRITAIAVMLKGAQSYAAQTARGQEEELNFFLGLDDRDLCNCRIGQCRELTEKCREDLP